MRRGAVRALFGAARGEQPPPHVREGVRQPFCARSPTCRSAIRLDERLARRLQELGTRRARRLSRLRHAVVLPLRRQGPISVSIGSLDEPGGSSRRASSVSRAGCRPDCDRSQATAYRGCCPTTTAVIFIGREAASVRSLCPTPRGRRARSRPSEKARSAKGCRHCRGGR